MISAVLWPFKLFCSALWLYNILLANDVAGEHIYVYMVSKYFTVLLVNKTKFSKLCHALKNSVAVKGLKYIRIQYTHACI